MYVEVDEPFKSKLMRDKHRFNPALKVTLRGFTYVPSTSKVFGKKLKCSEFHSLKSTPSSAVPFEIIFPCQKKSKTTL